MRVIAAVTNLLDLDNIWMVPTSLEEYDIKGVWIQMGIFFL